jgi:autophagy-related protein 9
LDRTGIFVYWLSTFVFFCIDYSKLPGSQHLGQVMVPKCSQSLPWWWMAFIWGSFVYAVFIGIKQLQDIPRLWDMHNFYHFLLEIPDRDIQTVTWQFVVGKLMLLRDSNAQTATNLTATQRKFISNQSKQRMDAHDIANRLMRRENYWIAMINKDVLDCSLNLPYFGQTTFYSRVLEWGISICLMDFVFDDAGQVRQQFRSVRRRGELIKILQNRFRTAGFLALIFSAPLALASVVLRFLRSYTEYQKNPALLGTRKFSLLAEWKIRDYNEVSHLFHVRKRMAYAPADVYLQQFPKDKTNQFFRFLAFIPGSFAAVLGVITFLDPEMFLTFNIGGHTVLFLIGVFSTAFVLCRGIASDDDDDMLNPEISMKTVVDYIHYCPDNWRNKLHSDEVRAEFAAMYKLEAVLFFEEIIGVFLTPFILMWTLPTTAANLVDFFREFTIHVDGLGTICSFAEFNFKNDGKVMPRSGGRASNGTADLRDEYFADNNNKLMHSYISFLDHYGPNPKRGTHGRGRRPFHPPPTFPGMAQVGSPSFVAGEQSITGRYAPGPSNLRQSVLQQQQQQQPQQHTPRFGPVPGHGSPERSILLDPHHQPRSSPRQRPHRGGPGTASIAEEGISSGSGLQKPPGLPPVSNLPTEEDSDLGDPGDSWQMRGDAPTDETKHSGTMGKHADGGILTLLMDFQNAPKEKTGGHV